MKEHVVKLRQSIRLFQSIFVAFFLTISLSGAALAQPNSSLNTFESQKNSYEYDQDDLEDIDLTSVKSLRDSLLSFFRGKLSVHDYADLTMSFDGLYAVKFKQRAGEMYQEYLLEKVKDKFDEKKYKKQLIKKIALSYGISLLEVSSIKVEDLSLNVAAQKVETDYEPLLSVVKFIRMIIGIPSFGSK